MTIFLKKLHITYKDTSEGKMLQGISTEIEICQAQVQYLIIFLRKERRS